MNSSCPIRWSSTILNWHRLQWSSNIWTDTLYSFYIIAILEAFSLFVLRIFPSVFYLMQPSYNGTFFPHVIWKYIALIITVFCKLSKVSMKMTNGKKNLKFYLILYIPCWINHRLNIKIGKERRNSYRRDLRMKGTHKHTEA